MSRRALWLLPAAAAAVVVVLVVGLALGWDRGSGDNGRLTRPFAATTSLSRSAVSFGDPLRARLDVVVDPQVVDPRSVEVEPSFGTYRVVGQSLRTTEDGAERLSYRYALECLDFVCVPPSARVEQRFQPARISYRTRDGQSVRLQVSWPPYLLSSQLTEADRSATTPRLRVDATVPPATYRIAPGTTRALLTAFAALLALAAAVLAGFVLRPRAASAVRGPSASRLEQALRAVRASSANGRPAERRKALGWLGRELRAAQRSSEADEARRLAWSAEPPTARSAGDFAAEVESTESGG